MLTTAVALGLALIVAACGGSSHTHPASPTRTSTTQPQRTATVSAAKREYIAKADALCKSYNERQATLKGQLQKLEAASSPNDSAMAAVLMRSVDFDKQGLQRLMALKPPAGDEAVLQRIWATTARGVAANRAIAVQLAKHNMAAVDAAEKKAQSASQSYYKQAQAYGFTYCGVR